MINFISYNGRYPNLCCGTLVLEVNGEVISLNYALCSGGSVSFDNEWNGTVTQGEWIVNLPVELEQYRDEITELVNCNVPYGCCGGCV